MIDSSAESTNYSKVYPMRKIQMASRSSSEITAELGKLMPIQELSFSNAASALLFDFADQDCDLTDDHIAHASLNKIPVIVLNGAGNEKLLKVVGLAIDSNVIVLHCFPDFKVIQRIDSPITSSLSEEWSIDVNQKTDGTKTQSQPRCHSQNIEHKPSNLPSPLQSALLIEKAIQKEHSTELFKYIKKYGSGPVPTDLPLKQYKFIYIELNNQPKLKEQTAYNSLFLEFALIASFNPKCKYLRLCVVGAGCHPANGGNLEWNDTYSRGYFQNKITFQATPRNAPNMFLIYDTSPDNINNQTTYTEESSFTVGVDVSAEPSFNPSYTISHSKTTTISDFDIKNNSSNNVASWFFELGMMMNSVWDMFDEPFMRKAQVKSLPNLATSNLQPNTETIWRINDDPIFAEKISIDLFLQVSYYHCWVDGDWTSYTKWYHHYWPSVTATCIIDFGSVSS